MEVKVADPATALYFNVVPPQQIGPRHSGLDRRRPRISDGRQEGSWPPPEGD